MNINTLKKEGEKKEIERKKKGKNKYNKQE